MQTKTKANLRCHKENISQKEEGGKTYRQEINNRRALVTAEQKSFALFLSLGYEFEII